MFVCTTRTVLPYSVSFLLFSINTESANKFVERLCLTGLKLHNSCWSYNFAQKKLRPANIFVENCISRFFWSYSFFLFSFAEFIFQANIMNWICILECLLEGWEILLKFSLETKKIFEGVWRVFTLMEWMYWLRPR